MAFEGKERQLVAMEYPGTVVNAKAMMTQLGGNESVRKVLSDPTKRMELRFRPGDPHAKPVYGDKFTTTSIVVEVVRRRKKRKSDAQVVDEKFDVSYKGFVDTIYKYTTLCDFQVLPADYKEDGSVTSLLPKLIPSEVYEDSYFKEDVPLFVTPPLFSRFDSVQSVFSDAMNFQPKPDSSSAASTSLIGTCRPKRACYAVYTTFENPELMEGPTDNCLEMLKLSPKNMSVRERVVELYEERPIWSKIGVSKKLNCEPKCIRYALASVAYRFTNGPFRTLWVKFGYDPRKDAKSKIYQLLDFRIKSSITLKKLDESRTKAFDYYMLPMKVQKAAAKAPSINVDHLAQADKEGADGDAGAAASDDDEIIPSNILMRGHMPLTRQCYFQLCDIHYDEIQKLVHQNDGREQYCHEKEGWCDLGVLDKCRAIINAEIQRLTKQSS